MIPISGIVDPDWLYSGGTLRFAGGQPDYDVGQAEEIRVQPPVNDARDGRQLALSEL